MIFVDSITKPYRHSDYIDDEDDVGDNNNNNNNNNYYYYYYYYYYSCCGCCCYIRQCSLHGQSRHYATRTS